MRGTDDAEPYLHVLGAVLHDVAVVQLAVPARLCSRYELRDATEGMKVKGGQGVLLASTRLWHAAARKTTGNVWCCRYRGRFPALWPQPTPPRPRPTPPHLQHERVVEVRDLCPQALAHQAARAPWSARGTPPAVGAVGVGQGAGNLGGGGAASDKGPGGVPQAVSRTAQEAQRQQAAATTKTEPFNLALRILSSSDCSRQPQTTTEPTSQLRRPAVPLTTNRGTTSRASEQSCICTGPTVPATPAPLVATAQPRAR